VLSVLRGSEVWAGDDFPSSLKSSKPINERGMLTALTGLF
jgi:hypothetical protein